MHRSSFRTFQSFLNPRAHSAHNMWTTLWSFRRFSSKTQTSFILSTITEQWKFSYGIFTYIQKTNFLFECIPLNFDFTVHSQFEHLCPKSHKIVYFLSKRFITNVYIYIYIYIYIYNRYRETESVYAVPAGWNLDLNRCTSHATIRRFPQTDRMGICLCQSSYIIALSCKISLLSRQRTRKAPLLFTYNKNRFSHDAAHFRINRS